MNAARPLPDCPPAEQKKADVRDLLRVPALYVLYQRLVGGYRARRLFAERYLRPRPGARVLDIGCGPGYVLDFLPPVRYVGLDLSAAYIDKARAHYGDRGTFHCLDVADYAPPADVRFDLVLASGVLHHLDDGRADRLFGSAARVLAPGGRLVTLDGVYVPGQPTLARWLLDRDRGEHVRDEAGYRRLAAPHFEQVRSTIVPDLFHVPYTSLILECAVPEGVG